MARSTRHPTWYRLHGANPPRGKQITSGELRAKSRDLCDRAKKAADPEAEDLFVEDVRDSTRGSAGTREPDFGWRHFGDGRVVAHGLWVRGFARYSPEWIEKQKRK
jgi:hypothetical protein